MKMKPVIPLRRHSRNWRLPLRLLATALFSASFGIAHAQTWSDPATWGGTIPGTGANVTIPAGKTVILNTNTASLGLLDIQGTLQFANANVSLTAKHILVHHGRLEVGTEAAPFTAKAVITLTGADDANYLVHEMSTGTKGLVVHGGVLELHGSRRSSAAWTKLSATKDVGATQITVTNTATGWVAGDKIVIAPSGIDPYQAEVVTITSISGSTINFTPALQFKHWGTLQTYDGKTIDERAEVGLLSRNITIQGDAGSSTSRFGAHVMVMEGSTAHVEGVLFSQSGQKGKLGRYAFHWHLAGDVTGSYIRDCSINISHRRGIVVHGTDNAKVQRNVAYNVVDHTIVAEAGDEENNLYEGNLVVLTKKKALEDTVPRNGTGNHAEARPGSYWIRNPMNYFRNNVAAGGEGMGIFYDGFEDGNPGVPFPGYPVGLKVLEFNNNVGHSYNSISGGNDQYPTTTTGWGFFTFAFGRRNPADFIYSGISTYKCNIGGIWTESDMTVTGAIAADNACGLLGVGFNILPIDPSIVQNSVIVGRTANTIMNPDTDRGGILWDSDDQTAVQLKGITFINQANGGLHVGVARDIPLGSTAELCRFVNTIPLKYSWSPPPPQANGDRNYPAGGDGNYAPTGYVLDKDGTVSGVGVARHLVPERPVEVLPGSTYMAAGHAYASPVANRLYLTIQGNTQIREGYGTLATITRESDGASNPMAIHGSVLREAYEFLPTQRSYRVALTSATPPSTWRVSVSEGPANDWVTVGVPVTGSQMYAYRATVPDPLFNVSDAPDPWNALTAVTSISAVSASAGNAYYFDSANQRVYVKIVMGQRGIFIKNSAVTAGSKVAGTVITNSAGTTGAGTGMAFDGNFSTYYNSTMYADGWIGYDLGTARTITRIRFAPRVGYASRMNDSRWEVSNTPDFSSGVVEIFRYRKTPIENAWTDITVNKTTTKYRYVRHYSAYQGFCNVSELEWYGY